MNKRLKNKCRKKLYDFLDAIPNRFEKLNKYQNNIDVVYWSWRSYSKYINQAKKAERGKGQPHHKIQRLWQNII